MRTAYFIAGCGHRHRPPRDGSDSNQCNSVELWGALWRAFTVTAPALPAGAWSLVRRMASVNVLSAPPRTRRAVDALLRLLACPALSKTNGRGGSPSSGQTPRNRGYGAWLRFLSVPADKDREDVLAIEGET